jgi:hypothetical protein
MLLPYPGFREGKRSVHFALPAGAPGPPEIYAERNGGKERHPVMDDNIPLPSDVEIDTVSGGVASGGT